MISGRGRMKIRPPRRAATSNGEGEDFDSQWLILSSALREIHEKDASKLSFEHLYRASYKIVLKKQGEQLYDKVKEYEEQWFGQEVMPTIRKLITKNLVNVTLSGISGTTANERRLTGEMFLKGIRVSWEDHITVMNMTTDILMYMDRVYCTDERRASIFTTSVGLFRNHILYARLAKETELTTFDILTAVILDQIGMEREGDVINKHLIRSCIYMLEALYLTDEELENEKLYIKTFEPRFLEASKVFYRNECKSLLREADASSWLRQTKRRLEEEDARCQTTISLITKPRIAKVVEVELISSHLQEFLAMEGSGIQAMIDNDRYEDLSALYQLISRVDSSKDALKTALQARVFFMGSEINKTIQNTIAAAPSVPAPAEDGEGGETSEKSKAPKSNPSARATIAAIKWVDEVLQLKSKFDTMWKNCLNEDLILQTALTKSFSDFINLFPKCSEYVSLFIDDHLKRGIKGKTEAEVDEVLDRATTLLRFIQDKDMFERYYKKHLARRLLLNKSESSDVEKQMISRMKLEIGNSFTTKLEGMFKDMAMSEELTAGYRNHISNLGDLDRRQIELGVNVLTLNTWPMESVDGGNPQGPDSTTKDCTWPSELQTLQESFKAYYLKERNGRKLTWLGYLGNADIRCVFPKVPGKDVGPLSKDRRHEINLTTYCMMILLLFNDVPDGETLSFDEIQQRTNIPTNSLTQNLHTLSVHPKVRVLNKTPAGKVKLGDNFAVNLSFYSKTTKIRAPLLSSNVNKVEGDEERKETEDKNDANRAYVIDTVIVRIMKARKELASNLLAAEVINQLQQRFKPDIRMVKKQIDNLIEKEYLERVEDAAVATYRYMA